MQNSIKVNSQDFQIKKQFPQNKQSFKGIMDGATAALCLCDKYPMINVAAVDMVTAIAPRTALDAKTNGFAAFETFRRESSGLIVNCLIPSFIVLGVAKLLQGSFFGDLSKKLNMSSVWANQDSIEKLSKYYGDAKGATKEERVKNYVNSVLNDVSAVHSKKEIKYKNYKLDDAVRVISDAILDDKKVVKNVVNDAYGNIVKQTRAAEIIKVGQDPFGSNLSGLLNNMVELGRRFKLDEVASDIKSFNLKSTKLVNAKSIVGLAVIIPLAMSMQSINRAITKYMSGSDGAPIYKSFGDKEKHDAANKDRKNLLLYKTLSVGAMFGVAVASMAKIPTMQMFQFKGLFPTMDQCRWISASTFGSRMAVADDKNELRETFIRDVATFASLYWLGEYASKLAATVLEKINPNIELLNYSKVPAKNAGIFARAKNWVNNVSLKSFDEVKPNVKNLRTACQLCSFGFSTLLLGLLIPWYTRKQTEKNERKEQLRLAQEKSNAIKDLFYYHKKDVPQIFQKFSGLQNSTN